LKTDFTLQYNPTINLECYVYVKITLSLHERLFLLEDVNF